jgi:hypothetical protein
MSITRVEHFSKEQLVENLRKVTMLKQPEVYPYKDAEILLINIDVRDLFPAQRYVLMSELQKVRELEWELQALGYSMFQLDGYLKLHLSDFDEPIDLLPPVVEESVEANGFRINLINDGMHRLYTSLLHWAVPQVILVKDVPEDYPYYAFPNLRRWDDVEIIETLHKDYVKKWHRIPNHHTLYRNFNSSFQNVGGPRKTK